MKGKKNLKGFTLVELIVVMAVFGIIMLGAMQFLDPVNLHASNKRLKILSILVSQTELTVQMTQ